MRTRSRWRAGSLTCWVLNLLHLLDQSLAGRKDEAALEWQRRVYTFGELDARSNRVAHALQQRGFAKGDRLCVYLPNRIELIDW